MSTMSAATQRQGYMRSQHQRPAPLQMMMRSGTLAALHKPEHPRSGHPSIRFHPPDTDGHGSTATHDRGGQACRGSQRSQAFVLHIGPTRHVDRCTPRKPIHRSKRYYKRPVSRVLVDMVPRDAASASSIAYRGVRSAPSGFLPTPPHPNSGHVDRCTPRKPIHRSTSATPTNVPSAGYLWTWFQWSRRRTVNRLSVSRTPARRLPTPPHPTRHT